MKEESHDRSWNRHIQSQKYRGSDQLRRYNSGKSIHNGAYAPEMEAFVTYLKGLGEPTTILMEYTGHYHYPVLKSFKTWGFPFASSIHTR